ncbi:MAG: acyltransferase [Flavobacteriales bacterium]|nr:acyltransferase [Flavobacteriales bacterium]
MLKLFSLNINYDHRVFGLDVIRAIAIIQVLFGHSISFLPNSLKEIIPSLGISSMDIILSSMRVFDGVDLFFVLSGFLIGSILVKLFNEQKEINFGVLLNFWKRRWYRTVPAYFLVLSVNVLVYAFFFPEVALNVFTTLKYYAFLQNISVGGLEFFPESWSLSVEEWFYISFPLALTTLFVIAPKMLSKKQLIFTLVLAFLFIITAVRFFYGHNSVEDWNASFRTAVIMRLDIILLGVLAAAIKYYYNQYWEKYKNQTFILGLIILLVNYYFSFFIDDWAGRAAYLNTFFFTAVGLGMMLLLPKADSIKTGKGIFRKVITYTSLISYSLYLINYTLVFHVLKHVYYNHIRFSMEQVTQHHEIVIWCVFILTSYFISIVMYKYFEVPVMKLRDRSTKKESAF